MAAIRDFVFDDDRATFKNFYNGLQRRSLTALKLLQRFTTFHNVDFDNVLQHFTTFYNVDFDNVLQRFTTFYNILQRRF